MEEPDPKTVGDLAIVLHSHLPYVEGFGTYPFGEEWLFDAVAHSHLPVLGVAKKVTMTVTPVLADQLEAEGVGGRLGRFLSAFRIEPCEQQVSGGEKSLRPAARSEAGRYRKALAEIEGRRGDMLSAFTDAQADGGVALMSSAATHAVLPMLATESGVRLQIDAGRRSHRRRFGPTGGFWLPECAYRPGLDRILAEQGVRWTCLDQSGSDGELEALAPVRAPAGPVAFSIDWPTVELVWSPSGYPSDPAYLDSHRRSASGTRLWRIDGAAYDPAAAAQRAADHAAAFLAAVKDRLDRYASTRGRRGLCVVAVDTELLGEWWAEGPIWLDHVCGRASQDGVELVTLPEALTRHIPEERPLSESSWGEGKDLRTWGGPGVADFAVAARRLELRVLRAAAAGLRGPRLDRAARELLAVQSSDWAFMASRLRAGDYAYDRAVRHAEESLDALSGPEQRSPSVRNLAPDLDSRALLAP